MEPTELWHQLIQRGYIRTVKSLFRCMRLEELIQTQATKKKYLAKPYEKITHPEERIQIDIKVISRRCITDKELGRNG